MQSKFRWVSISVAASFFVAVLGTLRAEEEEVIVRNDKLLEQLHDEWRYPNTGFSGRGRTGSIRTLVQQSEEPYAKVWQHYASKCGYDQKFDEGLYVLGREVEGTVYLIDDRRKDGERTMTFFVCNALKYSVSVILEPKPGKQPTRICVTITAR